LRALKHKELTVPNNRIATFCENICFLKNYAGALPLALTSIDTNACPNLFRLHARRTR